jgi:hypothetical protein
MPCQHFSELVSVEQERDYVNSVEDNNCIYCLVKRVGPMTQEQVAMYLDDSVVRISQIEIKALKKLRKKIKTYTKKFTYLNEYAKEE